MNGSLRDSIRELIQNLRNHPRVTFYGSLPDIVEEPYNDIPEGRLVVAMSHTAALEWADILEAYLDGTS